MKLIILRHEERPNNSLFFTPLTKQGKINAYMLKDVLPENVDIIYSSSFLRTLETIYGGKNSALPIEFLNTLDPKFEPRLFSVLCYAKVGRVGQKLLALVEKAPMKDGETIKMIKLYWT